MRGFLVGVTLLAAACTAGRPADAVSPQDTVTLATFTGEVDLAARKFTIRSEPTPAARLLRARGLTMVDPDEVTVSSTGAWFGDHADRCNIGASPTWGADVTVTTRLDPTWLGGVHAEITEFTGGTGNEGCTSVRAPSGMSNAYGLWSYGTLQPGSAASTVRWAFRYATAARFTFRGRIVAAKVDTIDVAGEPAGATAITTVGDKVAYSNVIRQLALVDSSGALAGTSPALVEVAIGLASVPGSRVWYTTAPTGWPIQYHHVGYLTSDLTDVHDTVVPQVLGRTDAEMPIAPEPGNPDRAWTISRRNGRLFRVETGTPPVVTQYDLGDFPSGGVALSLDGTKVFVTYRDTRSAIEVRSSVDGSLIGTAIDTSGVSGCGTPYAVVTGPDGNAYFSNWDQTTVCMLDTVTLSVTNLGPIPAVTLCTGLDGNVWYTTTSPWVVGRLTPIADPSTETPTWAIGVPGAPFGCAGALGYMWSMDTTHRELIRIQP